MPLLQAIVNLELATLTDESMPAVKSDLMCKNEKSTKRVHFSGFDGSAMKPPVDVLPGSDSHQLECLNVHLTVVDEIKRLQSASIPDANAKECLHQLTTYLRNISVNDASVCAESVQACTGLSFGAPRVLKAAKLYLNDLEILASRLSGSLDPSQLLCLEQRLADSCGQLIRHHLRDIFNPVPCRAQFILSGPRARRISEYVLLQSLVDSEAADDGCLSSLVSYALRGICELFGSAALTGSKAELSLNEVIEGVIPASHDTACESGVTKLRGWLERPGLGAGESLASDVVVSEKEKITEDEWEAVFSEVWQLGEVLAVFHGSRFLYELFTAKGVLDALERGEHANSWNALRSHAHLLSKSSYQNQSWARVEDEHLSVLGELSLEELIGRLVDLLQVLEPYFDECEKRLRNFVGLSSEGAKMCLFSPKRKKGKRRSSSGRRSCVYNARKQEKAAVFYKAHKNELDALVALVEDVKQRSSFYPKVLSLDDSSDDDEDFILDESGIHGTAETGCDVGPDDY